MNAMALGTCQPATCHLRLATCHLPLATCHLLLLLHRAHTIALQIVGRVTPSHNSSRIKGQSDVDVDWALLLFRYSLPNAIVSFVIPDGSPRSDLMKLICHRMWHRQPPQPHSLLPFPFYFVLFSLFTRFTLIAIPELLNSGTGSQRERERMCHILCLVDGFMA